MSCRQAHHGGVHAQTTDDFPDPPVHGSKNKSTLTTGRADRPRMARPTSSHGSMLMLTITAATCMMDRSSVIAHMSVRSVPLSLLLMTHNKHNAMFDAADDATLNVTRKSTLDAMVSMLSMHARGPAVHCYTLTARHGGIAKCGRNTRRTLGQEAHRGSNQTGARS